MSATFKNLVKKFHNDEEGLEALQVVMIIAIAAMVMVAASTVGKGAVTWMTGKWSALQGQDLTGGGAGGAGGTGGIPGFPGGFPKF